MHPDAFDAVFLTAFVWADLLSTTEYYRSELLLVLHDASSFNAIHKSAQAQHFRSASLLTVRNVETSLFLSQ